MMKGMALVQTDDKNVNQLQQNVKQVIDPLLKNAVLYGNKVNQNLVIGSNTINHGLGRTLQGWIITEINGSASIYRVNKDSEPARLLYLVSSAAVNADIYCF